MNRYKRIVAGAVTLLFTNLLSADLPSDDRTDWVALFDGKSLGGWIQRGGKANYRVEDGCIVGTTVRDTPNSFLCTTRDYANFILELEFKVDPTLNSGVQIRSESRPDFKDGRVHGYQVEIDPSPRAFTGGVYDEARRGWLFDLSKNEAARRAFRQNEWNRFRIEALGDTIRTWVNGVPAADLVDAMTDKGFIALQVHSSRSETPLEVRWRHIRLHKLGDTPARPGTNYLESKVGSYTLPDPLVTIAGEKVTTREAWRQRRAEIVRLFETHVFGRSPGRPADLSFQVTATDPEALGGKAIRKEITIRLSKQKDAPSFDLLVYLPAHSNGPVPLFVGLNFRGNHTIHSDAGITLSQRWMPADAQAGVENNRATERSRGTSATRWSVESILARGYGVATMYCGDIDPDVHDGFQNGVHPLFYKPGQTQPAPDEWGTIAAWAWGLSRAMDYIETDRAIDARRVAVIGHSRLGKTSLWAGALDERFAIVISNNSGCGGAALSMRNFGETVKRINTSFPHWFCANFREYDDNESALPVDQHMLLALAAPRPVYVASASEDFWADPRGEFLGAVRADPVYRLLGLEGLPSPAMPPLGEAVFGTIGYHQRIGPHDVTEFDWQRYMDFADKHCGKPGR